MSWKAVEMQVALPRVQDASKIQEQIQQRGQFIQDTLAAKQLIQDELRRKNVNESEYSARLKNERNKKEQVISRKRKQHNIPDSKIPHPYLGGRFDINS
ncbi:hypothetical protein [Paraliobacillus salinarum]|uniref:hypothetical protein n=1 Tax=Paraliobacillus salinarum TaxID=1158996 RepID=UPI0015F3EE95|nr:hypothetical protein [Paraliobacillus salinarum]